MACAKPMLVSSGVNSPIIGFLSDKSCAMLVVEKNVQKKVDEIADKLRNADEKNLSEMGRNGYNHVLLNYTKEHVTSQYIELVNSLLI